MRFVKIGAFAVFALLCSASGFACSILVSNPGLQGQWQPDDGDHFYYFEPNTSVTFTLSGCSADIYEGNLNYKKGTERSGPPEDLIPGK
jgi:hypothetical protein